jgi:hypothetical protein
MALPNKETTSTKQDHNGSTAALSSRTLPAKRMEPAAATRLSKLPASRPEKVVLLANK